MDITSAQGSLSDPRLPPELERLIFEFAALSHPLGIATSMLVAGRVKDWVEPFLYRVLYITSPYRAQLHGFPAIPVEVLLRSFIFRPALFETSVECLFLDRTPTQHPRHVVVNAILSTCPGITTLLAGFPLKGISLDILKSLRCLRRLSIHIEALFASRMNNTIASGVLEIDFLHPAFRNVTHLELLDDSYDTETQYSLYAKISHMPCLTHVAFNDVALCCDTEPLFQMHAQLRCLVFLGTQIEQEQIPPWPHSDRFVHIRRADYVADWFRGAQTGEDYWALAEEFIAAKRAGRVARLRYSISDTDASWRTNVIG
ncbi:hypothetical protein B0H16DRAFT_1878388 [Mycena metata]|uniref:Uncharacterized protein n=1 Tax=Mycena metata TaxID=1033252 RepID=A0AAD7NY09_9AGAR|nr:hypothetical protein B0H16DRAFT_1878388 [Mycena metata]